MKSMGKRFGMYAVAGILLITLAAVQTAAAAEVQRYVMGSGPMGGPWKIGVGAGVQTDQRATQGQVFRHRGCLRGLGGEHAAHGLR